LSPFLKRRFKGNISSKSWRAKCWGLDDLPRSLGAKEQLEAGQLKAATPRKKDGKSTIYHGDLR